MFSAVGAPTAAPAAAAAAPTAVTGSAAGGGARAVNPLDEDLAGGLAERLLGEMAGADMAEEEVTAEEREYERVEQLIEQMSFLRERGDSLSHEARRERAATAAMEMARMFGDELGGEMGEEDEEEHGQLL